MLLSATLGAIGGVRSWLGSRPPVLRAFHDDERTAAGIAAALPEPLPTPHTLRHTAVTHWIAAGVDPFRLAKWAGHRSVATIYRVYGHLLDLGADDERAALSAIRASAIAARVEPARVITFESRR